MSNDDAFSPFVESPQRAVAGLEKRTAGTRCRVQKLRKSLFFFFLFLRAYLDRFMSFSLWLMFAW